MVVFVPEGGAQKLVPRTPVGVKGVLWSHVSSETVTGCHALWPGRDSSVKEHVSEEEKSYFPVDRGSSVLGKCLTLL